MYAHVCSFVLNCLTGDISRKSWNISEKKKHVKTVTRSKNETSYNLTTSGSALELRVISHPEWLHFSSLRDDRVGGIHSAALGM